MKLFSAGFLIGTLAMAMGLGCSEPVHAQAPEPQPEPQELEQVQDLQSDPQPALRGGIADLDIEPAVGIPLAGYGSSKRRLKEFADIRGRYPDAFFFRPSDGRIDPIRSKVMVLEKGKERLVFISLDMIGVTSEFVHDLAGRLEPVGIQEKDLFVSGTHTHSGPGTVTTRLPLAIVAVDLFVRKNYEYILDKTTQSVFQALSRMEEVELFTTEFETLGLQKNKFRDDHQYDRTANLLLAKSRATGNWLGGMINYAIHGGALGPDNHKYSADVPGAIERHLETRLQQANQDVNPQEVSHRPSFLFMNGAEGDVGPARKQVEGMEWIGAQFADQAWPAIQRAVPVVPTLSHRTQRLYVGVPSFPIKDCRGKTWMNRILPRGARMPIAPFMPSHTTLSLARVGNITMVSYPGEASTTVGLDIKEMGASLGHEKTWVLGLTNDYLAYFTNKAEYFEAHYDSCSSLYNWRGARRIQDHYRHMMQ